MGIPTAEGYTPSGAASTKRGARGCAARGGRVETDLLRCCCVREFAWRGSAVAVAYVSYPLCLVRLAGYRKTGVGDGPGDAGRNKRPVVQKTGGAPARHRGLR